MSTQHGRLDERDDPCQLDLDALVVELADVEEHLLRARRSPRRPGPLRPTGRGRASSPRATTTAPVPPAPAVRPEREGQAIARLVTVELAISSALTSGVPPDEERPQRAHELRQREQVEDRADERHLELRAVDRDLAGLAAQPPPRQQVRDDNRPPRMKWMLCWRKVPVPTTIWVRQRQVRGEPHVEGGEARDHVGHQQDDQPERQGDQHGRVGQRRGHLAPHRLEHLLVVDVACRARGPARRSAPRPASWRSTAAGRCRPAPRTSPRATPRCARRRARARAPRGSRRWSVSAAAARATAGPGCRPAGAWRAAG